MVWVPWKTDLRARVRRKKTPRTVAESRDRVFLMGALPSKGGMQEATGKATASCEQTAVLNVCTAAASALRS